MNTWMSTAVGDRDDWLATAAATAHVAAGVSTLSSGICVEANEAFCRLFRLAREQIVGHPVVELGLWAELGQRDRLAQRLRRHSSVTGFEARYRNSLGETGDVEVSARIVERGSEPYLISFLTEVTDRRELIEGLRAAQSRLGIVLRASDMLVFRQDEALRYTWVANPALGATEDELLGRTDEDIMGAAAAAPLLAIEGLDVARALVNVGGQVGVLRRVLDRFVQAYAEGAGPLDRERVHSLRGACAAIGAVDLQSALQAYESAAARAETEELPQRAEAIAQRLRDLVERLRSELAREAA